SSSLSVTFVGLRDFTSRCKSLLPGGLCRPPECSSSNERLSEGPRHQEPGLPQMRYPAPHVDEHLRPVCNRVYPKPPDAENLRRRGGRLPLESRCDLYRHRRSPHLPSGNLW